MSEMRCILDRRGGMKGMGGIVIGIQSVFERHLFSNRQGERANIRWTHSVDGPKSCLDGLI